MALMDIRAIYLVKNVIQALLFHAFGAAPLVLPFAINPCKLKIKL